MLNLLIRIREKNYSSIGTKSYQRRSKIVF